MPACIVAVLSVDDDRNGRGVDPERCSLSVIALDVSRYVDRAQGQLTHDLFGACDRVLLFGIWDLPSLGNTLQPANAGGSLRFCGRCCIVDNIRAEERR